MIKDFKLSLDLKEKLWHYMKQLPEKELDGFIETMAHLATEVSLHNLKQTFEELRKGWSDVLDTMFLIEPRKPKPNQ